MINKEQKTVTTENPLRDIINSDTTIQELDRDLFLDLADIFFGEFEDNLYRTSIDLSLKYPNTTANEWMIWQNIPGIKKYKEKFIHEQINVQNSLSLSQGEKTQGAVQVRKMLDAMDDNSMANFIVMRLPDREDDIDG